MDNSPSTAEPLTGQIHEYRMPTRDKATCLVLGIVSLCFAVWIAVLLLVPHLWTRSAPDDRGISAGVFTALFLLGCAASLIRSLRTRLIITDSQVVVIGAFSSHTIPYSDIKGYRNAGGRGVSGIYLYRRDKSRVFVRESSLQLDDFYKHWRACIYDLDKAERLKRKAAGKPTMLDWFAVDDADQHPTIGGPDVTA